MNNPKRAGKICGNPLCGLCERVCLDVRQITDGCIARFANRAVQLEISPPVEAVPPFSYGSAQSVGVTTLADLSVTALADGRSRVRYTEIIPLTVQFTDSTGTGFTAATSISLDRDIILTLPTDGFTPYEIQTAANVLSRVGSFASDSLVTAVGCIVIVTRVVVPSQLLFPSYGTCEYPSCEEYADSQLCNGVVPDPLFRNG